MILPEIPVSCVRESRAGNEAQRKSRISESFVTSERIYEAGIIGIVDISKDFFLSAGGLRLGRKNCNNERAN